ncbi:MAG TPA: hypothetical protein VIM58_01805 [Candidatus Methylacidiphilales bacterium]
MIRIKTAYVRARAQSGKRPPGYLDDVLAHGTVDGDEIVFDDAAYAALAAKYRTPQPTAAAGTPTQPTPPPTKNGLPDVGTLALNLAKASARFAATGFKQVHPATLAARKAVCAACPDWEAQGYAGLGRCRKCGCSGVKLGWASERCPAGKWEAELPPPHATS